MPTVTSSNTCTCCGCANCSGCAVDPDPGCCTPCGTPDQITITIVSIEASPNELCNTASPWDVDILDVSGMVGRSFVVPYVGGCGFSLTVDVTAWFKVLACDGDSSGCPSCTPTTDITSSVSMTIDWTPGTFGPRFSFTVTTTNTIGSGRNLTTPFSLIVHDADDDDPTHTCCQDWTASCATAGCPDPSTEDFFNIFITSLAITPC